MHDRSSSNSAVSAILQDLRPARATYGRLALLAPWGIDLCIEDGVRVHLVAAGRCLVRAPAGEVMLGPGDVAMLPQGGAHAIVDAAGSATVPLASLPRERLEENVYRLCGGSPGGSGNSEESVLVCCTIDFDALAARRLLAAMPGPVVVRAGLDAGPGLDGLMALLADEARRERIGMTTLLPRLAVVVVIWIVRAWVEGDGVPTSGWLDALADPRLGPALAAFHHNPGGAWNLASLAREAGLSRSAFAARFHERVGQPPGHYVLDWRMALAAERLAAPGASTAQVAAALGYGSEAAFSRAFKRTRGRSPSTIHRRTAAP